jgi:ankyrin repeat protein
VTNSLPTNPDVDLLKKQAKKLLQQHRANNSDAIACVKSLHPKPEKFIGLRDAQLYAAATLSEKADLLIRLGCVQYSGNDTVRDYQRAYELLELYPNIADFSFYSALVSNNKQAVQHHLQLNSRLATAIGGPLNWPALLYATYSRISEPSGSQQSIEIVQLLLDNGADPNSHVILNDAYRFTALTGVMGEGEQGLNQPPHQQADELAKMLLEAGANPNDSQGLYNTMFTASGDKWLAILIKHGLSTSHKLNWDDPHSDPDLLTPDEVEQETCKAFIELLLASGADITAKNDEGRTPVDFNRTNGAETMADLLSVYNH